MPAITTHCMCQLATSPEWVQCTLPASNTAASLSTYFTRVLSAKKRAAYRLATERWKCFSNSADSLLTNTSIMSPKDLSRFWRKLHMIDPIKPTNKATVSVFQDFWATVHCHPPIP